MPSDFSDSQATFSFRSSREQADAAMDMTPMVDVTFLLLIFFMVTAAFALQKAMSVPPVPEEEVTAAETLDDFQEDLITIRVDGDNMFWVSAPLWLEPRRAPSVPELRLQVRNARQEGVKGTGAVKMLLEANGDAVHESVVAALDAGIAVGIEDITLKTYEDEA